MVKKKIIPLPLETEKATVVVDAEVPAVLLDNPSVPATTTKQEDIESNAEREARDRVTEGQRRVNMTWEFTQGAIAIILVLTVCIAMILEKEVRNEFWLLVAIVVQSYFQRTNHTRVGGVGYKPLNETR